MLLTFTRTDLGLPAVEVYINPAAVTAILPGFGDNRSGSGVCVHGFTYPIIVDQPTAYVAAVVREALTP